MKHYLITLILISIITGGLSYLSSGFCYEKQIRYLSMLLTLLALLSPLPTLLSSVDPGHLEVTLPEQADSAFGMLLKDKTEERINEQLCAEIIRRCGLKENDFTVRTELILDKDRSTFSMSGVEISLHSIGAVLKREEIRSVVKIVSENCVFKEEPKTKGGTADDQRADEE
ncbi:MAG: hypothetical protein IJX59_05675 [Clostridia bacterium]|nr:hypothetical protein [Clostridia bacterium]MBQ9130235.1 hypothetical protein [Clostridia bacterium]